MTGSITHPLLAEVHPMCILTTLRRLGSAAAVFFGGHGAVSQLARRRDASRQSVYREADAALGELEGDAARRRIRELQAEVERLRDGLRASEAQRREAVVMDGDRQGRFAATGPADGVSAP